MKQDQEELLVKGAEVASLVSDIEELFLGKRAPTCITALAVCLADWEASQDAPDLPKLMAIVGKLAQRSFDFSRSQIEATQGMTRQ